MPYTQFEAHLIDLLLSLLLGTADGEKKRCVVCIVYFPYSTVQSVP